MAQRRTKKQKQIQTEKIEKMAYSLSGIGIASDQTEKKVVKANTKSDVFAYSVDYIRQDLKKTMAVTVIVLCVLAVIVYLDFRFA